MNKNENRLCPFFSSCFYVLFPSEMTTLQKEMQYQKNIKKTFSKHSSNEFERIFIKLCHNNIKKLTDEELGFYIYHALKFIHPLEPNQYKRRIHNSIFERIANSDRFPVYKKYDVYECVILSSYDDEMAFFLFHKLKFKYLQSKKNNYIDLAIKKGFTNLARHISLNNSFENLSGVMIIV